MICSESLGPSSTSRWYRLRSRLSATNFGQLSTTPALAWPLSLQVGERTLGCSVPPRGALRWLCGSQAERQGRVPRQCWARAPAWVWPLIGSGRDALSLGLHLQPVKGGPHDTSFTALLSELKKRRTESTLRGKHTQVSRVCAGSPHGPQEG